jgi:hypothetical protein
MGKTTSIGSRSAARKVETLAWRTSTRKALGCLLLAVLVAVTACQSPSPVNEQWTPLYLQLHLSAGKARAQWLGESEWTVLENGASATIEEMGQIIADDVEGARFSTGDGSTLELNPGAVMEVQNPRTLPHLQVTLRDGTLLFTAQEHSYEISTPACSVSLPSIPSQIKIEVNGETTRLAVMEGAATCTFEEETLTLPTGREMVVRPNEEPEVFEFCVASTAAPAPTMSLSPPPTPWWLDSTPTLSPTSAPTATLTATPTFAPLTPSRTSTPTATLTATPTFVPPTRAPPTDTPIPPPPPTSPPKPAPTKPPPTQIPPPTNTRSRPTSMPPRPTRSR